ncbi:hypothetical protein JB92DRAFT_2827301 [Gautieria morchelliformis]|nr:hypothetical protein JB92DRAFT_2827301 [Gautieria morchelliformis]
MVIDSGSGDMSKDEELALIHPGDIASPDHKNDSTHSNSDDSDSEDDKDDNDDSGSSNNDSSSINDDQPLKNKKAHVEQHANFTLLELENNTGCIEMILKPAGMVNENWYREISRSVCEFANKYLNIHQCMCKQQHCHQMLVDESVLRVHPVLRHFGNTWLIYALTQQHLNLKTLGVKKKKQTLFIYLSSRGLWRKECDDGRGEKKMRKFYVRWAGHRVAPWIRVQDFMSGLRGGSIYDKQKRAPLPVPYAIKVSKKSATNSIKNARRKIIKDSVDNRAGPSKCYKMVNSIQKKTMQVVPPAPSTSAATAHGARKSQHKVKLAVPTHDALEPSPIFYYLVPVYAVLHYCFCSCTCLYWPPALVSSWHGVLGRGVTTTTTS